MIWFLGALSLGLGIYLGLPGDRRASEEESREALERGGEVRHKTKRATMWIDYLFRGKKTSSIREREANKGRRKPFDLSG